jgi:hypothetical protein
VPEVVDGGSLVAWTRCPDIARAMAAVAGEEPVDLAVAERPDTTTAELGGDASAVPVGQEADGQGIRPGSRPRHE